LIESELFGHTKGAFTSAIKDRKGKFELAHEGTLFLDEIGDMSLSAQAKVLRALQENTITPVGADKSIAVNVRVLAATNKDLEKEMAEGRFREDLYHRLSVIVIKVPGLDQRKEDIPALASHFGGLLSSESGFPAKKFTPAALQALQARSWSGNIRQLRNVVERLFILCGTTIEAEDIERYA
jgi:two-component system nitrogen regulation response regulator NtrX